MLRTCFSTASSVINNPPAIPLFDPPSAMSESTSRSLGERTASGAVRCRPATSSLRSSGSTPVLPLVDPSHRVDKIGRLQYSVLEEVTDAVPTLQEVESRIDLDVRREHENPHLWILAPNRAGCIQSLLSLGRGHADVDDHQVRQVMVGSRFEGCCVTDFSDDLEACAVLHARDAFPNEHVVVRYHHPVSAHAGLELTPAPNFDHVGRG